MHSNRGRPSQRRLSDELRKQVVTLAGRPGDLRRQAGQKPKGRRRPPRHRSRRDRRSQEGRLRQVDGSLPHWFGPDQPHCTLLAAIDAATGAVVGASFREQEDAQGYFLLLKQVMKSKGIPLDLYHDRHAIFQRNSKTPWTIEEELQGRQEPTQFGRALAELGITAIAAHSPQAKGRVERLWGTLQGRLVQELRLAGITDLRSGNRFLDVYFKRYTPVLLFGRRSLASPTGLWILASISLPAHGGQG